MSTALPKADNQLNRLLARISGWPPRLRHWAVGLGFGYYTPYFRYNRLKVADLTPLAVTLSLANHRMVRNHLGGIHAVAINLACEYACGLLVGQHVPDSALVVVKTMHMDLHKRITGAIRATATLTREQAAAIRTAEKGEIRVPVRVVDEVGITPITGYMDMAWYPRKRSAESTR